MVRAGAAAATVVFHSCPSQHLLKACVKGAVFALEKLLPSVFVPVMAPDALDVARGEFTEFAVKNGFCLLLRASSSPGRRHGANTAVVSCQGSRLVVIQLLLNIGGLRVRGICGETGTVTWTTEDTVWGGACFKAPTSGSPLPDLLRHNQQNRTHLLGLGADTVGSVFAIDLISCWHLHTVEQTQGSETGRFLGATDQLATQASKIKGDSDRGR